MVPAYKKSRAISTYAHYVARYKTRFYSRMGFDIVMGRREGIYFWDLNGKRYINCHSNGGVFNLGHRNPDVTRALEQALGDYDIGNHHLISGPRGELARRLCESMRAGWLRGRFRESIDTVIFGVSGGEAVDLAIKPVAGRYCPWLVAITGTRGLLWQPVTRAIAIRFTWICRAFVRFPSEILTTLNVLSPLTRLPLFWKRFRPPWVCRCFRRRRCSICAM